ncbi:AbrB/MazE/SpoVT family DNA-binding domain-containing protein (plasmid) [Euhalothece natronophila Z-M001]|uniref:AbrB/MazE/SpoVT family DNA-binding domain-containing protein n=1 Tax=Euhalothece natronophila Z-M001 TaxID=522448 RepID=A0A5B8NSY7_9CHRO|nr:AbrB/MazE/SpoVT family DNA-binding domain-containing protein [Euhalothece natronophila]QDZ41621.1 AbrB/MazE/SpoVT family DNA-binding domain-containing protein [Euhalothece natronophila Z-M001]
MKIQLRRWGNSLGLRVPQKIAQNYGLDENSLVELTETPEGIMIQKRSRVSSLDELLSSIPDDFEYPEDTREFNESGSVGEELI